MYGTKINKHIQYTKLALFTSNKEFACYNWLVQLMPLVLFYTIQGFLLTLNM